jgi:hypothetical protein
MVNPYLQVERLASDIRNQSLLAIEQGRSRKDGQSNTKAIATGYNATGNKIEDSLIGFGRWFLFCQRCRHGGHSSCITAWFNHHKNRNMGISNNQKVWLIIIYCYFYH